MDAEKSAQTTEGSEHQLMIQELRAVLGEKWVNDSPAVLSRYHGTCVRHPGENPEVVVFPSSVREIKEIVDITRKHEVPLFSMSVLFNHTEVCVSKHGGVIMDLRRMDIVGG